MLLEAGANVNETDRRGRTAYWYAKACRQEDVRGVLEELGAADCPDPTAADRLKAERLKSLTFGRLVRIGHV